MLIKIKEDSNQGLKEFHSEYGKFVYGIARSFRNPAITDKEVFQEVMWKVWQLAVQPRIMDNPKGWIYTVTVNAIKSIFRKREFYPLKEDVVATKDEIEEFIEKDTLEYMLQGLSEQEKYIVTQKAIDKTTFSEIAQTMRKPIGSISSIYYRSVDKIKEKLEKNEKK